ncbi:MAG: membrane protein [Bacteroidota bacterium]|nr:MAG: membrane protein [Bacteroidota bacterium]
MLFTIGGVAAQPCTIQFSGLVVSDTGEPLTGATLKLNEKTFAVADQEGKFHFKNLCRGEFTLTIQFVGYHTKTVTLSLTQNLQQTYTLYPDITQLQEVIVADQLQGIEHAYNFAALTEKQLAATAGKTLGEAVKELAGVNTIQAGPGIFKPVIHGVHSQRILILNYGIRQEGQQWGAEHAPEIDPMMASNIVVIKDASAIKYGTDALGGVIIVNPAPLPESPGLGGSVNAILQSNGRSGTISGVLEGGINNHKGWGWRTQGTLKRAGDFHTPDYNLTNTGIQEMNFSGAVGYHNEGNCFEIYFSRFQSEIGILKGTAISNLEDLLSAFERVPPLYTSEFSYSIGEPRQTVSHNLLKINSELPVSSGTWKLQYGFQNNNRREYDIRIGGLSQVPAIHLQLNTHTLETEFETKASAKQTYSVGVTGMYQDNKNIPGTQRIPFIPNFVNLSGGAFGISKFSIGKFSVDAGIRYDYRYYQVSGYDFKNTLYQSQLSFSNLSATLGASRQLQGNQKISTSLSSAWRPPHVAELYSLGTHQSAAAIEYGLLLNDSTNEVMNMEDVTYHNEQAMKWVTSYTRAWTNLQLDLSAYANYIFNYIYQKPTGVTQNVRGVYPYFRYTQTDALFAGADVAASWKVNTHWSLHPKATLLWAADVKQHDYLVFIPPNRYELTLRYDRATPKKVKNFFAESRLKVVDQQHRVPRTITVREFFEAIDNNTDPLQGSTANFDFMDAPHAYALMNVATGVTLKNEKVQYDIRLVAENLLNTTYREYTNRFRYYANDLGSNFLLSLKCTF